MAPLTSKLAPHGGARKDEEGDQEASWPPPDQLLRPGSQERFHSDLRVREGDN